MHDFNVQPVEAIAPAQAERPRLPTEPGFPFLLGIHPKSWEPIETDRGMEWLPMLKKLHERPGVNAVGRVGDNSNINAPPDSGLMETESRRMGWAVFNHKVFEFPAEILALDNLPDLAGRSYMIRWECQGNRTGKKGHAYSFRWERPRRVGDGVSWDVDRIQEWAVRRWFVSSGLIPPPDPTVTDRIIRIKRKRIQRNQKQQHNPACAAEAERSAAELDAMLVALENQDYAETLTIASKKRDLVARAEALGLEVSPRATKREVLEQIEAHNG